MSLFEKKYHVVGRNGKKHSMTAKKLYERVMKDSESDYKWIASATELFRVCKQFKFPEKYAQEIQIAILNRETKKEIGSYQQEPRDVVAVNFCYNSLADVSEEANKARQKYLKAVIKGITKYHFIDHYGPTYHKICEEWKRVKFEEYSSMSSLDFYKLPKYLYYEFDKTMKTAEEEGAFLKDDEKHLEEMRRKFWSSLNLGDI